MTSAPITAERVHIQRAGDMGRLPSRALIQQQALRPLLPLIDRNVALVQLDDDGVDRGRVDWADVAA